MSTVALATKLFDEAKEYNPYLYFELAYTRATDWMAHFQNREGGTKVVLATGQGATPDEACEQILEALEKYLNTKREKA